MEFPHIGRNCSYKSCNKLDFLPMKCDACREVYCSDHFSYIKHECTASNARDVQVPECPLCGSPVPGKRDEPPDVAVSAHIDNQCMSDPARERRKKVFTNKCSYKGCKTKEMVPLVCAECALNYCLRHRHAVDHTCDGKLGAKKRQLANAAMARIRQNERNMPDRTMVASIASFTAVQGNMTEDEALAHALALSLQEQSGTPTRETTIIRELAGQRVGGEQSSRCTVS
ncbi:AN1-type zinc finger protein 2A-like [Maniola hyperantus]|uniref:AN1-type zinc finger protein 2A-like n=1 Tax=Aphantopus hyperantus TaxID=2795564 RepID=UPI001568117C|nr:AN1-type zinc finger protein 2A-like [Maniola hyperantus]